MRLILVRHGETAWNLEGRSQGSSDIALNERGRWQAARLAEALCPQDIAAVYASPLLRARETAATIAAARRIPVYLQDGLRELEQGLLEGMTPQEMWREYPELLQRWRTNAAETQLPQGESLGDLQQRTWAVVVRILAEHPKEMVLLVSHNLAIVTILCRALGISLRRFRRIRPSVASISTLEYRLGQWALMSFNDTCHLKDEGLGT